MILEHLGKGVLDVCNIMVAVYDYKTHHIRSVWLQRGFLSFFFTAHNAVKVQCVALNYKHVKNDYYFLFLNQKKRNSWKTNPMLQLFLISSPMLEILMVWWLLGDPSRTRDVPYWPVMVTWQQCMQLGLSNHVLSISAGALLSGAAKIKTEQLEKY